jgi:hypothetical protein
MDKELIWKVLTEEQGCKLSGEDCNKKSCLRYYTCKGIASAITKLFTGNNNVLINLINKLEAIACDLSREGLPPFHIDIIHLITKIIEEKNRLERLEWDMLLTGKR